MHVVFRASFDEQRNIIARAIPGQTLGAWLSPHTAHITAVMVNDHFLEEWQAYQPKDEDRLIVFVETGIVLPTLSQIITYAIMTIVATAISIGLQSLIRALTPTPHQTEGKVEQVYGIAACVAHAESVVYAGALVAVPPGLAPLLRHVMGLPFRLGARHPQEGAIDCQGLVAWLLAERLAQRTAYGQSGAISAAMVAYETIWAAIAPGARADGWRASMEPWDVLVWQDRTANAQLKAQGQDGTEWVHVGLAISPEIVVTSTLNAGVILLGAGSIEDRADETVIALLRPRGIQAESS